MTPTPILSRADWQAVSIALADAGRSPCAGGDRPGPVARVFAAMTGIAPPRPLADPRLEAVRRFVCTARRTRATPQALVPTLLDQGYTRPQVEALALLAA